MKTLRYILEQEEFQKRGRCWKPANLLPEPYRRLLLKDLQRRTALLLSALPEFEALDRAPVYALLIKRLQMKVQQAKLAWRFDDLAFVVAVAGYYSEYGDILRLLATDKARGRLETET